MLSNSLNNKIDFDILLQYPIEYFEYIKLNFKIIKDKFVKISDINELSKNKHKSCYFVFKKSNWFIRNEMYRYSFLFNPYKSKFNVYLYKMNIIDYLLKALITENNQFIDFNDFEKENIDLKILTLAAEEYLKKTSNQSKIFHIDKWQLSIDSQKYLDYNARLEQAYQTNDTFWLPSGQEPKCPSPIILDTLIQTNPGLNIDELLDFDENIMEVLSSVRRQKEIFNIQHQEKIQKYNEKKAKEHNH